VIDNKVFSRTKADSAGSELSASMYNLVIGLTLLWGFAVNAYLVNTVPAESLIGINPWLFFGGYFACCIAGVLMFSMSSNPLVSFIGYNLVVVPFGLVLTMLLSQYEPDLVQDAINATAIVTLLMMALSTAFPRFFAGLGSILFISLLCAIIAEVVLIFVFKTHLSIMDWIVALIFCGYIGFDWYRANNIPRTLDNAIDSAAALYMDIINLFIRILQIISNKN
jgi:FtsH-binding integral membrane protein